MKRSTFVVSRLKTAIVKPFRAILSARFSPITANPTIPIFASSGFVVALICSPLVLYLKMAMIVVQAFVICHLSLVTGGHQQSALCLEGTISATGHPDEGRPR